MKTSKCVCFFFRRTIMMKVTRKSLSLHVTVTEICILLCCFAQGGMSLANEQLK
jgi:hypothetical protein